MLKGKAEIILTDVNTGKKEIIKENNLVTNALNKIANINMIGNCPISKLFPLKKAVQGLFVIDTNLPEDADSFILPYNSRVLAHADNTSNADDIRRGSFNSTESEDLDNGFKFVWDFATHQANGNIKCLSLTSTIAGKYGFGATYEQKDMYIQYTKKLIDETELYEYYKSDAPYDFHMINYNKVYKFDFDGGTCTITAYEFPMNVLTLTSTNIAKQTSETYKIKLDETESFSYKTSFTNDYLYFIVYKKNGSNYEYIKVYEVEKNNFTIKRKIRLDTWYSMIKQGSYDTRWRGVVNGDYIYMLYNSTTSDYNIYKINLTNPNDIKIIENKTNTYPPYSNIPLSFYNNRLFTGNFILENDELNYVDFDNKGSSTSQGSSTAPLMFSSFYDDLICFNPWYINSDNKFAIFRFLYNPFYLATINNLSSPIVKTADKTMKVIYTITNS